MLVLTRKEGECIKIGPDIEVYVGRIDRNHVRLAIKAPRSIHVLRGELVDHDQEEQYIEGGVK